MPGRGLHQAVLAVTEPQEPVSVSAALQSLTLCSLSGGSERWGGWPSLLHVAWGRGTEAAGLALPDRVLGTGQPSGGGASRGLRPALQASKEQISLAFTGATQKVPQPCTTGWRVQITVSTPLQGEGETPRVQQCQPWACQTSDLQSWT